MTAHPSPNAVNTQLLRVLGILATDITAADIELRPGLYPLVTYSQVVRTLRPPTNGELREELHRYRLVPEAQPTFNLDAMCEQAREAVEKTAYDAWLTHLVAIKEDFEPLRRKAGERLLQRVGDVLTLQAGGAA